MPQRIPFFSLSHMSFFQKCSRSCSRLHLSVSVVLSPPTSPTLRETGGVDKWMRSSFFFLFFFLGSDGGTEGGRRHRTEEVKQIWQHKDGDGQRNPVLAPGQHTSSFRGCEDRCCSRRAHYEMTLTQPDLLRRIIRRKSLPCISPPTFSRLFTFPEILSPPVWRLLKLHVHLTQKDAANVPLARFNRSHFLGSLAALIYLEDRLLIQRDWDARRGESAAVWVLNSSRTPIDGWGWATFIEHAARKIKEK